MARGSTGRTNGFRPDDDFYPTPRQAIVPLIRSTPLPNPIWEPACGTGSISQVLEEYGHTVVSSNLEDRGFGRTGVDFLEQRELYTPAVQSIITNPPFALANDFIAHAIELRPRLVAMFGRLKLLEGARRYNRIMRPTPPAFVYIFVERIKFFAGDTPEAEQPGWNNEAFAWFVWLRDWPKEPVIRWLRADDGLQPDFFEEKSDA